MLLATVILPLAVMLANIRGKDIAALLFASPSQFRLALGHSVAVGAAGTIISILIAYAFALCVARTRMPGREFFAVLATLPMLIPSISHGMGLLLLLGTNGLLTRLLGLHGSIYGFQGIVVGSALYAFPVAFLMIVDILKYEDGSPYEAAAVLGIPRKNQFFSIALPYLRKPLIAVVFATFSMIFTDYGVSLMIGGRYTTLPVLMYQEVIGLLNFSKGSVIGAVLLVPALIAFIFDITNKDRGNQTFVIHELKPGKGRIRDRVAMLYCTLVCMVIALPLGVFAVLSFVRKYPMDMRFSLYNIIKTMNMGAGRYLVNSLLIALGVSIIGTILAWTTAYFTARTPGKSSRLLHLISITSLAIPGLVLGLSYVIFFNSSFIYGSMAMLILVNAVHFLASPYLMAYNSLGKLNGNLEDVGLTLGIGRFAIIRDILAPQTIFTILEMFSYFFVNSMVTISAVSFLATVHTSPISLMINQFEAQMLLESSAFVSILILACNFIMKTIVYVVTKYMKNLGASQ
jgi:iron(III) transport system permease protein